jgi:hypothetical protein
MVTEAGRLDFDNEASRCIVAALQAGPRSLAECGGGTMPDLDLSANGLALCCAGIIVPVTARPVDPARLNAALRGALNPEMETSLHVMPRGNVLRFGEDTLKPLIEGAPVPEKLQPWADFLQRQG